MAMILFDSGVTGYVTAETTVQVHFPVDKKGVPDVRCAQCPFLHRSVNRCQLNDKLVAFPQQYIGQYCPLQFEEVKKDEI